MRPGESGKKESIFDFSGFDTKLIGLGLFTGASRDISNEIHPPLLDRIQTHSYPCNTSFYPDINLSI